MSFKPSSRVAAPLILASLGFFALHCSSDEGSTSSGGGTSSISGAGGSIGGSGTAGGGMTSGGSAAGSTPTAGTGGSVSTGGNGGSAGSTAGSGGSGVAGSGGGGAGGGGAGGGGGSGGSGGGSGATFAQVKGVLMASCKGSKCHDPGNEKNNIDLTTADGLYTRLTMPIPQGIAHCDGTTLVVPGNVGMSFLATAVAGPGNGKVTCKKGGGTEMIARMPDDCPDQRPCLMADQIKVIQDWIAAGAPQ